MNEIDERWQESNPELVEMIRDEIARTGPITFHRFMELALYHPQHGYYQSKQTAPGRGGDFLTAPEAHPIFGATLAAQIIDFDRLLAHPEQFTIIEYGAGAGRLIRPLLAEIRQVTPELYERVRYAPVETNARRMQELHDHLVSGGHGSRLLSDPPKATTGCVLANEFLDALPIHRITRQDGGLREAYVDWHDDWFAERLGELANPATAAYLKRHAIEPGDGEWREHCPGIAGWAAEIAVTLVRGFALVIDYGYPASVLYAGHRRTGTAKAYFRHGASEEFYRGVGRQDLTAHVNFSEIAYQAKQHGFESLGITTQADLLTSLGIGERLMRLQSTPGLDAERYLGIRAAVMRMIDPGAMGRFRALVLARGIHEATRPIGLGTPGGTTAETAGF
jgi:SAM-dependent MidA family methyltransferase